MEASVFAGGADGTNGARGFLLGGDPLAYQENSAVFVETAPQHLVSYGALLNTVLFWIVAGLALIQLAMLPLDRIALESSAWERLPGVAQRFYCDYSTYGLPHAQDEVLQDALAGHCEASGYRYTPPILSDLLARATEVVNPGGAQACVHTEAAEFGVLASVLQYQLGVMGKVMSLMAFLMGLMVGVIRVSVTPMLTGVAMSGFLYYGPAVLSAVSCATAGAATMRHLG